MAGIVASGMRRTGAWIALAAMLVALILPLVPRDALAAAAGIEATVICTPYGIKVVAADHEGQALPDPGDGSVHCPLCVGPGGGWVLPAATPLPFRLPLAGTRLLAQVVRAEPPVRLDLAAAPNAPRPPPAS